MRLGARKVTLRNQWGSRSKYARQSILSMDCEDFAWALAEELGWDDELLDMALQLR